MGLFGADGSQKGKYESPSGSVLCALWNPDSSGVYIWDNLTDFATQPQPIMFMDRHGGMHTLGLDGINPERSADGQWVAATHWGAKGYDGVWTVPAGGGAALPTVQGGGVRFLGWRGKDILYFAPGGIYSIPPGGGSDLRITSLASGEEVDLLPDPVYSPDGKVTLVLANNHQEYIMAEGRLNSFENGPFGMFDMAYSNSWTGPHATVGFSSSNGEGEALLVDLVDGAVERHSGITLTDAFPKAASWPWLAWAPIASFQQIHFTNLEDKTVFDLGTGAPDIRFVFPYPDGRFLLESMDSKVYFINPAGIHP